MSAIKNPYITPVDNFWKSFYLFITSDKEEMYNFTANLYILGVN